MPHTWAITFVYLNELEASSGSGTFVQLDQKDLD